MATTPKNLYVKILEVSSEVRNIEKNMVVGVGNSAYKAVSDLDVVLAVKDAEKKHGIVSIPIKQEIIDTQVVTTKDRNGFEKSQFVDIVKMTTRIVDVDNPTDYIEVEAYGRGVDSCDKGFGKASTYARKYCLLNAYKIATGEDPDKDASEDATIAQKRANSGSKEANGATPSASLDKAIEEAKKCKTIDALKKVCTKYRSEFGKNADFVKATNEALAKLTPQS